MLLVFVWLLSFGFSANAQTDVTTGYYHIVSKATQRNPYLYNNSFLSGNTNNITLQNATAVTTNNGIWYVTVNDNNTLSIVNGDGKPMVAGSNSGSTVVGTYSTLTIGKTSDDGGYRYYYFTEAIDATDGTSTNCALNGIQFITTWTGGSNTAEDLLWRFEPVSTDGKTVYNVKIDGISDGYVTYEHDGTTENAYNGGFFIASSIDASSLKVYQNGTELTDASVTIENGEIRVSFLQTGYYHIINKDTTRPEYIYNNSFLAANTNKFTLQSDTQVTTNNGIWYIKRSDKTLSIVNGDGQPMVTGKKSDDGGSLDGTFSTLTIADSTDVAPYRYYLFSEKINCTESSSNCKLSDNTYYITTWSDGTKNNDDMLWRFEPVSTEGKTVYSVDTKDFESLESLSNVYVVYTHDNTTENAYNGGFFIASSIDESNLKVYQNGTALSNAAVDIENGVIKVKAIVSLGESTDNSTAIGKYKGLSVDVKVNRTMTQGQWNTLCFPFTMSDKNFQNLKQYSQIKACKEVKDATMLFEDATSIEAGKPYLVKPTNALFATYITGFSDVTMASTETPTDTGDSNYKFIGVYNQKKFSESEATKSLILVTDGKLVNPVKETTMKALRAYFTYPGTSDGAGVAPRLVIDGVETALTEVISSEEISDGRIYNLRGMYVGNDASRLAKGVYIMNGKKVIIK
jgi:hypothetical protein